MLWFGLDTRILNLVVISLRMMVHFGEITMSSKNNLPALAHA